MWREAVGENGKIAIGHPFADSRERMRSHLTRLKISCGYRERAFARSGRAVATVDVNRKAGSRQLHRVVERSRCRGGVAESGAEREVRKRHLQRFRGEALACSPYD
jgi:hypothetical protein